MRSRGGELGKVSAQELLLPPFDLAVAGLVKGLQESFLSALEGIQDEYDPGDEYGKTKAEPTVMTRADPSNPIPKNYDADEAAQVRIHLKHE